MKSVVILGAGRVGQTLGYLLQHSGKYKVTALWNRSRLTGQRTAKFIGGKALLFLEPAQAARLGQIVFITTPDKNIKDFCYEIAYRKGFRKNALVIHCSGNFSSGILSSARRFCACYIASLHPLQSFAQPVAWGDPDSHLSGGSPKGRLQTRLWRAEAIKNFRGTYCAYEGMAKALPIVRTLIKDLGGTPVKINATRKPLYHAAGVVASNYLVTLLTVAREFISASGFAKKDALAALMPLVEGTIKNVKQLGIPYALTGPVARGDLSTVQNHLSMIRKHLKHYQSFYQILGKRTIKIAQEKGSISSVQAHAFRKLFDRKYT